MLPIICPRCQITFETDEERNEHLQMDDVCPKKSKPDLYGIDSKQEKLLRSRKKGGKNMSEADKWRDVYLILFPNIGPEDIPSPCMSLNQDARQIASTDFDRSGLWRQCRCRGGRVGLCAVRAVPKTRTPEKSSTRARNAYRTSP